MERFTKKKNNEIGVCIQKLLNGTKAERSPPTFHVYNWDCDKTDTGCLQ